MFSIDSFERQFILFSGEVAEIYSINRSLGQLYGLLFISKQPRSLQDIAQSCQMSKGNASIQLRTLETWGAIHRTAQLGNRQGYYVANKDIRGLALMGMRGSLLKRISLTKRKILDFGLAAHAKSHAGKTNPFGELKALGMTLEQTEKWIALAPALSEPRLSRTRLKR